MRGTPFIAAAAMAALLIAGCGGTNGDESGDPEPRSPKLNTEELAELGALPADKVQPAAVDWADLELPAQRLFTVLSEIDATFRLHSEDIWNRGFRLDQTPLTFARRGADGSVETVYVVHHPEGASLPGAVEVPLDPALELGPVYRIDPPSSLAELPSGVPFDFDRHVGTTSTMAFFVTAGDPLFDASTWEFARLIVHETFHRHQLIEVGWSSAFPDDRPYPRDDANAALALLEDRVLDAMVTEVEPATITERLAQFLAIRETRRLSGNLGNLGNVEDLQEVAEGTARYVENRFAELSGRDGAWGSDGGPVGLDWLEFGRFYSSGAQLAWALEQLDADWKAEVASGASLRELVAEVASVGEIEALLDSAKTEFDYEALLAKAQAADLENAVSQAVINDGYLEEVLECVRNSGVDLDPSVGVEQMLAGEALANIDEPTLQAFDDCGLDLGPIGPASGPAGSAIGPAELTACLEAAGVEIGVEGLESIDLEHPEVQSALGACMEEGQ